MAVNFTLFLSGAWSDNAPRYNRMVDDSMPVIQLDVTENYTITMNNKLTNYAVEDRANISDHIAKDNVRIQAQCSIGLAQPYYTAKNNLIKTDQDNAVKSNRPQQAYDLIKKLRDDRIQFDLLTEQELFEGVVITELSAAKEAGTDQLTFNIALEQPRFKSIGKTVLAQISVPVSSKSIKNKTADKASEGNKNSGDTSETAEAAYKLTDQNGFYAKFLESQGIPKDAVAPQTIKE